MHTGWILLRCSITKARGQSSCSPPPPARSAGVRYLRRLRRLDRQVLRIEGRQATSGAGVSGDGSGGDVDGSLDGRALMEQRAGTDWRHQVGCVDGPSPRSGGLDQFVGHRHARRPRTGAFDARGSQTHCRKSTFGGVRAAQGHTTLGRIREVRGQYIGVVGDRRDRLRLLRAVVPFERRDRQLRLVVSSAPMVSFIAANTPG